MSLPSDFKPYDPIMEYDRLLWSMNPHDVKRLYDNREAMLTPMTTVPKESSPPVDTSDWPFMPWGKYPRPYRD